MDTLDEFDIIKTLGKGATGKVKLVKNIETSKYFAAKIFNPLNTFLKEEFKQLFTHEVEILKDLSHKNIVKFISSRAEALYLKS